MKKVLMLVALVSGLFAFGNGGGSSASSNSSSGASASNNFRQNIIVIAPRGPRGAQGVQGEQGVAGTNGTNGANGTNGRDGSNGVCDDSFLQKLRSASSAMDSVELNPDHKGLSVGLGLSSVSGVASAAVGVMYGQEIDNSTIKSVGYNIKGYNGEGGYRGASAGCNYRFLGVV